MLSILKGFLIAFSMYSNIPVPTVKWEEKSMKYILCFFPIVGIVLGGVFYFFFWLMNSIEINPVLRTAVLAVLPVLITGGIHMDGYLDTIDALSSNKGKDDRIKILSDPNAGAFAVIYGIVYFILLYAFLFVMTEKTAIVVSVGFVISRSLSALSVVTLSMAKDTGLAYTFSDMSRKIPVRISSALYIIVSIGFLLWYNWIMGALVAITAVLFFVYFRNMVYKKFGGITGDLCGYFLQVFELVLLIIITGGVWICL